MPKIKRFFAFLLLASFCGTIFAADGQRVENYSKLEEIPPITKPTFPTWTKDLRRFEVISLGSLPFTTLSVSFAYSMFKYVSSGFTSPFPNPMSKNGSNLTKKEQIGVIITSASLSLIIGVTDLVVNIINSKQAETQSNKETEELFESIIIEGE